jgi:16S rRNA (cytosine967-C5)-methyltransferase
MTPAARIEAAIDLLERIAAVSGPAENVVADYQRARRYMGSKDRRAVSDLVYAVLRRRARLDWWLERGGAVVGDETARARCRALAGLVLGGLNNPDEIDALFHGGRYAPAPLTPVERDFLAALAGQSLTHAEQPAHVRGEIPDWLLPEFQATFGADLETELAALTQEAPLDLRVNTLKGGRDAALAALAADGIEALPTPLSPLGLRVAGRRNVQASPAYRDGLVELQDEGSQVVALLSDARPDMAVADFCAGAGGKTLALAAAMENRGRLLALDVDQSRLDKAAARLKRAGVTLAARRVLKDDGWLRKQSGRFDRVLVDAPCSGSGAWRRHPDARWRLSPEMLAGYLETQAKILGQAATLVRAGGRLVYATCSLLPPENQRQVAAFLDAHPDFTALPTAQVLADAFAAAGAELPPGLVNAAAERFLLLTPGRHGTDGFYTAVLERRAA